jgi:hypothetical protein
MEPAGFRTLSAAVAAGVSWSSIPVREAGISMLAERHKREVGEPFIKQTDFKEFAKKHKI